MADQIVTGSKQQVAWELAQTIARAENLLDDLTAGLPPKDEAREYWFRLMDQCLTLLDRQLRVETIVAEGKARN